MADPHHNHLSGRSPRPPRFAIVGGGPAGAFCAIWLSHLTADSDPRPEIVVFDHKSFDKLGPAGCNMCAGVIPDTLVKSMADLGLDLPERVIQRRILGCYLETRGGSVDLPTPEGAPLYATFRGPGPLGVYPAEDEGFDWFILEDARRRGVVHQRRRVIDLHLPADPNGEFELICSDGFRLSADFVVGAFGVNSNLGAVFERLGFGYRAPRTLRARQAEVPVDPDSMSPAVHNRMVIFAMGWPSIRYAAITPKRRHVTVTLIGEDPSREDMVQLLHSDALRQHFPPDWSPPEVFCSCAPQLPITAARHPLTDRLVVIGDAHISRYLKNGIESSFYTAKWAAQAMAAGHTSAAALEQHYLQPCRRTYLQDNRYGRALLRVHDFIARAPTVARAHIRVAQAEQADPERPKPLTEILLGTFTGSVPYRTLLRRAASPSLQLRLARAFVSTLRPQPPTPRPRSPLPPSRPSTWRRGRVVIIGGGPAGTACAITLARGNGAAGPPPEVVLLEAKHFGQHQNQCAGVLSPPGSALVEDLLGGPLPQGLLQRRIDGYVLHGRSCSLALDGEKFGESPSVLRRVELDRLLLQRAREVGVKVVHARATDVEVNPRSATVYTDTGCFPGDAVIGAFALDATMSRAFSLSAGYRPPSALETLACKVHPAGLDFIPGLLDDSIHVFLPRSTRVDFGALIPKGNHIVVIIAGARLAARDLAEFLALPEVAALLPQNGKMAGLYKGAFPLGPAKGLYGDSFVIIGDAAGMVRPFKGKGINSAIAGGRACAEAILRHGLSRGAFASFVRSQRHLTGDVWYGRLVRQLVIFTSKHGLLEPIIQQAETSEPVCRVLFDCISGRTSYRNVVLRAENLQWLPSALWRCATWRDRLSPANGKGETQ